MLSLIRGLTLDPWSSKEISSNRKLPSVVAVAGGTLKPRCLAQMAAVSFRFVWLIDFGGPSAVAKSRLFVLT